MKKLLLILATPAVLVLLFLMFEQALAWDAQEQYEKQKQWAQEGHPVAPTAPSPSILEGLLNSK